MQSKKHTDFLKSLTVNKPAMLRTCVERKNEIRTLKIMLGKANQKITNFQNEVKILKEKDYENKELKSQIVSLEEHNSHIVDKQLKTQKNSVLIEKYAKDILTLFNYDFR